MTATTVQINAGAFAAKEAQRTSGPDTDWAGMWFDIIEKEAGEFVGMRAGRRAPGAEDPSSSIRTRLMTASAGSRRCCARTRARARSAFRG